MLEDKVTPGQTVRLRADQRREGVVTASLPAVAGEARYRVFHGPGDIQDYFASQIIVVDTPLVGDDAEQALRQGNAVDPAEFLARLTASRLVHPQVDNLYALYAARVRHVPFQFKPLLRLLRADQPRLLGRICKLTARAGWRRR